MSDGPRRDERAGALLRKLREDRGLSPEQMQHALLEAGLEPISGRTIRRVEAKGVIPHVRSRFALAQFFDREVSTIWRRSRSRDRTPA